MKNPLLIEDIEFIESNIESFQEHVGNSFNHYMNEWLSDNVKFNFWAFFLAPFWLGYKGLYEYAILYIIFINATSDHLPSVYLAFLFLFPTYLGFKGNILYFEKVKNNIKKGRQVSGGMIGVLIVILFQLFIFNVFYN
ncbi:MULTISPECIES: DUF2628 domain-containing protein [Fusobacterium]|uniref:DUF2628 domain-containing protein n=1 Tax=Fusobacterium TaxID=848 RepID=UPI001030990C|nr:DUF2628 domain-containing protein [Fusobacterium ulcerans]